MTHVSNRKQTIIWGGTLSLFLLFSYLIYIGFGLLAPASMHMHEFWAPLLPGFEWLTLQGFLAGVVDSFVYAWYIALLVIPLRAWISRKLSGADYV